MASEWTEGSGLDGILQTDGGGADMYDAAGVDCVRPDVDVEIADDGNPPGPDSG
jgi:hypothetical protein